MGTPVGVQYGFIQTQAAFTTRATVSSDLRVHTVSVVSSWSLVDCFHQWLWIGSIIRSGILHVDVGVRHIYPAKSVVRIAAYWPLVAA